MKATLLLLPLLAPSAALEHQLWDQGSLVQGAMLVHGPVQVGDTPLVKRAQSVAYSQRVLRSAALASNVFAAAGELSSQVKDKLLLTLGRPVTVPMLLDSLGGCGARGWLATAPARCRRRRQLPGDQPNNMSDWETMMYVQAEIKLLRNTTYVAGLYQYLEAEWVGVRNYTTVTSALLRVLKAESPQLNFGGLFEAVMAYFRQAAGFFQHMSHDIDHWWVTKLLMPNATEAEVERTERRLDLLAGNLSEEFNSPFNASGHPNCTHFLLFVQNVSDADKFFHEGNLSSQMAEAYSSTTTEVTHLFKALNAPDAALTVASLLQETRNVTLDLIQAMGGLFFQYKDTFEPIVRERLCPS